MRRSAPGSRRRRRRAVDEPRRRTRRSTASTIVGRRRLVERDAERVGVDHAQVDAAATRAAARDLGGAARHPHGDRVEERVVHDLDAAAAQRAPRACAVSRCTRRAIAREPFGPVVRRRTGRRSPRAAPARCRCCSSPSRAGCAARASAARAGSAVRPCASTDTPTSRPGSVRLYSSRSRGTRRAVRRSRAARRSAATCRRRRRRRSRPAGRRSVSASRSAATATSAPCACAALDDRARGRARAPLLPGILQRARRRQPSTVEVASGSPTTTSMPSGSARVAHDLDRLRMAVGVDEERRRRPSALRRCSIAIASAAAVPSSSSDALARSMPVRSRDHRLEVQQRFEPALRDLGLVRRVRRVPGRVLEHVAQDHGRRDRVVVAEPDERGAAPRCVDARSRSSASASASLSGRAERERRRVADRARHRGVDQRVERLVAERREHRAPAAAASGPMWRSAKSVASSPLGHPVARGRYAARRAALPLCRGT